MSRTDEYDYSYDTQADIYCYPQTSILINKFNIRDREALNIAERQITSLKIAELEKNPIKGRFDLNHLKRIHRFIFGDIYKWAGKIREGDFLIKGDTIFCRAMYIESITAEVYKKLAGDKFLRGLEKGEFIRKLAYYMGEINAIHPFREGNGRTQRIYFRQLCENAGYTLEFSKTQKDKLVEADIMAFNREYEILIEILSEIVTKK